MQDWLSQYAKHPASPVVVCSPHWSWPGRSVVCRTISQYTGENRNISTFFLLGTDILAKELTIVKINLYISWSIFEKRMKCQKTISFLGDNWKNPKCIGRFSVIFHFSWQVKSQEMNAAAIDLWCPHVLSEIRHQNRKHFRRITFDEVSQQESHSWMFCHVVHLAASCLLVNEIPGLQWTTHTSSSYRGLSWYQVQDTGMPCWATCVAGWESFITGDERQNVSRMSVIPTQLCLEGEQRM